ncbi:MAG: prepilin-type N-terminal cleavage/methylation domain-containing protein, partial [Candidatus Binatia bacterium]
MKTAIGTLKRRAGRQAFTLIEMLMVLGLIAVFFFAIA